MPRRRTAGQLYRRPFDRLRAPSPVEGLPAGPVRGRPRPLLRIGKMPAGCRRYGRHGRARPAVAHRTDFRSLPRLRKSYGLSKTSEVPEDLGSRCGDGAGRADSAHQDARLGAPQTPSPATGTSGEPRPSGRRTGGGERRPKRYGARLMDDTRPDPGDRRARKHATSGRRGAIVQVLFGAVFAVIGLGLVWVGGRSLWRGQLGAIGFLFLAAGFLGRGLISILWVCVSGRRPLPTNDFELPRWVRSAREVFYVFVLLGVVLLIAAPAT